MATIARDTPLLELTLRRYEKPEHLTKRELVRKLCLSMGLLQPGDSRDVVVDVLAVLLEKRKDHRMISAEEVRLFVLDHRTRHSLQQLGVAPSNIRRQLKRLRDIMMVEKVLNKYRITEYADLNQIMTEKVERLLLQSLVGRIKEYNHSVETAYSQT